MIPTETESQLLWEKYHLTDKKRIHVTWVAKVALFLADKLQTVNNAYRINKELLLAAALLHDIDKSVLKLPGESHPDAGVRVLKEEGMEEVAQIVRTHPLHAILDETIAPKTIEEKLLYLADKMVKQDIVGVEKRFALWEAEDLPLEGKQVLRDSYPLVKKLEAEVFSNIGIDPSKVAEMLC